MASNRPDRIPWQFPNRTEQTAAERHGASDARYVAAPWATWIDQAKSADSALKELRPWATQNGERHTVCQHVYWTEAASHWAHCGITDVWLSHAAESGLRPGASPPADPLPKIHAWPLYAVNVEDPQRRAGLVVGKDPRRKRYLASFIGAHMDHYISESRLHLQQLAENPSFHIEITGREWHFHGPTWRHQVEGLPLEAVYDIGEAVQHYNEVLSDSVFALCPAGAGRNSIRLWEAMAVGAVPVLMDEPPLFPMGGSLPLIDWKRIVIQVTQKDIPDLPLLLRRVPWSEIQDRQRRAVDAYQLVKNMTITAR